MCFAEHERSNAKPMSMIAMEKEAANEFFREYASPQGETPQVPTGKPKPTPASQIVPLELHEEELKEILDALKALRNLPSKKDDQPVRPTPGVEEAQLIADFWAGKSCLYGGSGWWKYVFF